MHSCTPPGSSESRGEWSPLGKVPFLLDPTPFFIVMVTISSIQKSNSVDDPQLRIVCFLSERYYSATMPYDGCYENSVFSI